MTSRFTKAQLEAALRFVTTKPSFKDHEIYEAPHDIREILEAFYTSVGGAHHHGE